MDTVGERGRLVVVDTVGEGRLVVVDTVGEGETSCCGHCPGGGD